MKIGFIGLGIMGESMCENIIKKQKSRVFVSDIDKSKVEKLVSHGATACENNAEVAQKADIIITMVPKSEHSMAVYTEILPFLNKGKTCIDMSTIDPAVSVEISEMLKSKGADFADAPVVKSKAAAISGTLGIYVGSSKETYEKIKPVLSYMGSNIIYMGENGMGLTMKICHNTLVAEIQNGVNETMILAQKAGISIDDFARAISYGGGQNFYLDTQAQNLKNQDWSTAFSLENMHKDLGICQKMSEELNFSLPGMENAKAVYDRGIEAGLGKEDFRATYKIVKENNGT